MVKLWGAMVKGIPDTAKSTCQERRICMYVCACGRGGGVYLRVLTQRGGGGGYVLYGEGYLPRRGYMCVCVCMREVEEYILCVCVCVCVCTCVVIN